MQLFYCLFPIHELHRAYDIMHQFADSSNPGVLQKQVHHLLFVTFHIQVGIGYLGIHFLRQEQHRRNQLIRMDMDIIDIEATTSTKDDVNNVTTTSSSSANDNDNDTTTTTDPRNGANNNNNDNNASSAGANGTSSKRIQRSSAQEQKQQEAKNGITQNNNTQQQQHHPETTATAAAATSDERRLEQRLQKSRRFQSTAAPFIFFTAIPYMTKIIVMGNANQFAMTCFQHDLHRIVRLNQLFAHSSHLVAMATQTATSPEGTYD
jgi:DNA mismatch repair ATPase MutL